MSKNRQFSIATPIAAKNLRVFHLEYTHDAVVCREKKGWVIIREIIFDDHSPPALQTDGRTHNLPSRCKNGDIMFMNCILHWYHLLQKKQAHCSSLSKLTLSQIFGV